MLRDRGGNIKRGFQTVFPVSGFCIRLVCLVLDAAVGGPCGAGLLL
jgi:hypothetical protein